MPPPKKKKYTGEHWSSDWIYLSDDQIIELLDQLGFDECYATKKRFDEYCLDLSEDELSFEKEIYEKAQKAIVCTRFQLSAYGRGVDKLDNIPTASDYKLGMEKIRDASNQLLKVIEEADYYLLDELRDLKIDHYEVTKIVTNLWIASDEIIRKKQDESRGRKTQNALRALVNGLKKVFEIFYFNEFYREEDKKTVRDKNKACVEFIRLALSYENIKHAKRLTDYFYSDKDPEGTRLYFTQPK